MIRWSITNSYYPEPTHLFAFLLSFGIILITWVNHEAALKLVNKSTESFIYANGFLLLTVVFTPFPTSLLGQFLLTDYATPAVVLYDSVIAIQAVGWILFSRTALKNHLTKDERSGVMRENLRNGYVAFVLYSLFAVVALWFPLAIAIVTTLSWIFWLLLSIRMKHT